MAYLGNLSQAPGVPHVDEALFCPYRVFDRVDQSQTLFGLPLLILSLSCQCIVQADLLQRVHELDELCGALPERVHLVAEILQ